MFFNISAVLRCCLFVACLFPLSVLAATDSVVDKITLVYEPLHNPPRALGRGTAIDWEKPGLTLELLRMIEQRLDIKFEFIRRPWKRGLYLLEKNEVDGIFHASYKQQREKLGVYPKKNGKADESRAIFYQSYALYTLNDSAVGFVDGKITHLDGSVGAMQNYAIADDLRKKG